MFKLYANNNIITYTTASAIYRYLDLPYMVYKSLYESLYICIYTTLHTLPTRKTKLENESIKKQWCLFYYMYLYRRDI